MMYASLKELCVTLQPKLKQLQQPYRPQLPVLPSLQGVMQMEQCAHFLSSTRDKPTLSAQLRPMVIHRGVPPLLIMMWTRPGETVDVSQYFLCFALDSFNDNYRLKEGKKHCGALLK